MDYQCFHSAALFPQVRWGNLGDAAYWAAADGACSEFAEMVCSSLINCRNVSYPIRDAVDMVATLA
jgi:hypothetical protein